jgi:hypothetical protein
VLNAQQDLMAARARLIGAQRDRVIAAYTLLSATGRLDVKTLGLNTPDYAGARRLGRPAHPGRTVDFRRAAGVGRGGSFVWPMPLSGGRKDPGGE